MSYEDGSFYYIKEIFIDEIYDKLWRDETFDLIIDAGAHVGIFTLKAAKKGRKILALEPHPINYLLLVENIRINTLNNVLPFKSALSEWVGVADLYEGDNVVINRLNLNPINLHILLKVYVEGSEVEVLRGVHKVLTTAKEVRVSCASYHYEGEALDVSRLLRGMGFKTLISEGYIVYAIRRD
jgi:predicted RNA methylase